jgi:hypothetical protein
MRRLASLSAVIVAVVGLMLVAAAAATAFAAPDITKPTTIHLTEKERQVGFLDLGAKGFSLGDRQTISSDLFNLHGTKVGRADDDCAITATGKRAGGVCGFVISLPAGQITGQFFFSLGGGGSNLQAINGGTGLYRNARGQLRVLSEHANTADFVIELIP